MGIGGQGISAVAQMLLEANRDTVVVTGCDMQASATTRALQETGIPVQIGHSDRYSTGTRHTHDYMARDAGRVDAGKVCRFCQRRSW